MFDKNKNATSRLIEEYEKYKSLVIAVDFDDTVFDFHNRGADYSKIINAVKRAIKLGHKVFIFTANTEYETIAKHCKNIDLGVLPINEGPLDHLFPSRKPYYNLLLDDRAGLSAALKSLTKTLDYQENN